MAGRTFARLEGDEQAGIIEETEPSLRPEERGAAEIFWTFVKYPIILACLGFIAASILLWSWDWGPLLIGAFIWAIIIFIVASTIVIKWIIEIPSDPPLIGAITIFGRITKWIAPAGYFLRIPYIRDVILLDTRRGDQDFEAQNLVTKDNATIRVSGHASYQLDPRRILEFIRSGKLKIENGKLVTTEGIPLIMDNMFLQDLRVAVNKLKLKPNEGEEGVLGASETLTDEISRHFTGDENFDIKGMSKDGRPDEKGLGIKIFVLNVTSIEPSGETKKAMEQVVQEKFQRDTEVYEVVTRGKQVIAQMFIQRGIDITSLKAEKITEKLVELRKELGDKFDTEFKELFETLFEWQLAKEKPGALIPGMRRRLTAPGGSIPLDVIGSLLAGLLQKPSELQPKLKKEKEKPGNSKKGKKRKGKDETEDDEDEE